MYSVDISIIIPAYNVEKYISKTLDSLVEQTFQVFEVIIINDGSTDNTLEFISNFKKKSNLKIKLISQENQGVSAARNKGINNANGKFLVFLDGDDYLDKKFLEIMFEKINSTNSDFCFCGHKKVDINGKLISSYNHEYITKVSSSYDVLAKILNDKIHCVIGPVIYKSDIIHKKKIYFSKYLKYGEDQEFILMFLLESAKAICVDKELMYYLKRENSATQNASDIKYLDNLRVRRNILSLIYKKNNIDKKIKLKLIQIIRYYKIPIWIIIILTDWSIAGQKNQFYKLLKFKSIRYYLFISLFTNISNYKVTLKAYALLFFPTIFYKKYSSGKYGKRFI